MCIEYHALNEQTIKYQLPLPETDEIWDQVGGAKRFSTTDLKSGYHHVKIQNTDVLKKAFETRYGQFECLATPFGLTGAPECVRTPVIDTFRPYLNEYVLIYPDDILINSKTKHKHFKRLKVVLQKTRENKLQGKITNCEFLKS